MGASSSSRAAVPAAVTLYTPPALDPNAGTYPLYAVTKNNYLGYTSDVLNNEPSGSFVIGQDGNSNQLADPAPRCPKNFTAKYACGKGVPINVTINPEAKGQAANFDCTDAAAACEQLKLTLGDDGNLQLLDSQGAVVWETGTTKVGVARPEWSAANGQYGRNYLTNMESLAVGQFMGSPSGNCYLLMTQTSAGVAELQLRYDEVSCPETGFGTDPRGINLATIPNYLTTNIGKIGFVSEDGLLHEYPESMQGPGTGFDLIGNYNSVGNDLNGGSSTVASVDACKAKCLGVADGKCGGFTYGVAPPPPVVTPALAPASQKLMVRYVRAQFPLTGPGKIIQISQLVVMSDGVNVAPKGTATAAGQYASDSGPEKAVDGVIGSRNHPQEYHSQEYTQDPARTYWDLDLGKDYPVEKVIYYNRNDCCTDRADGMQLTLRNNNNVVVKVLTLTAAKEQSFNFVTAPAVAPATVGASGASGANCHLKTTAVFPGGLRQTSDHYELYVRNKALKNNASCNSLYESVSLAQWQAYADGSQGDDMTPDTLCSLQAYTKADQEALAAKKVELDGLAKQIKDRITALKQTDANLASELGDSGRRVKHDLGRYDHVLKKRQALTDNVLVSAMAEDADLQMMSALYKNILWSIIAILLVLLAARLVRGLNPL